MDKRLKDGLNVVIYGKTKNAFIVGNGKDYTVKIDDKPRGMTMVASIIMKESIKRRAYTGNLAQNYGWVSYRKLRQLLIDKEEEKLTKYRLCDWLVVDDIILEKSSDKMLALSSSVLDSFFEDRISNNFANILVLKFDIDDPTIDFEQHFGISLNKLIKNTKTFKIKL